MFEQFDVPALNPWIHLVWSAPLVLALAAWSIAGRRGLLDVFGWDPARSASWFAALRRRRWRRAFALALALICLTAAAVQPRSNPERATYATAARDIVIILDVSRSMLAADLKPSRLERAKIELSRLADRLHGDRLGLIVFAGDAVIKCPLTSNYTYFKTVLRNVDTRSAPKGSTRIGDAVRKALSDLLGIDRGERTREAKVKAGDTVLEEEMKGEKETFADLLLITDGEDHDSYPVHAAQRAAQLGVGIYAVGLGSEEGSPILVTTKDGKTEYVRTRQGEVVKSRLDSRTLQDMVNAAPRGQYLPVGTYNFDLVDFYDKTIAKEAGRQVGEEQIFWTEIFQPFVLAGLVLYLVHLLIAERPRRGQLVVPEVTG
jgi:Ca-activated chloride channel family protein